MTKDCAKAVENCEIWAFRDQFRAFLFTLPVGMTAHDLRTLLEETSEKTCIINRSIETDNRICYAVIGFDSDNDLKSLVKLYEKKDIPISYSTVFGGKFWAQVVSLADSSGGTHFRSGPSSFPHGVSSLSGTLSLTSADISGLSNYLVVLECSLELLIDQVSVFMKKLSFVELVPLTTFFYVPPSIASVFLAPVLDSDMVLDNVLMSSVPLFSVGFDMVADFSSSSFKILITKIAGKFDGVCVFTSNMNSGYLGSGVAIIINIFLVRYVCKVFEIPG
ncbi:hypothetical protein G9A89_013106 [Geosiphon pyriformis]|nr:hypothetical protein G9A89_013106 [Geosiphon pyriformis]